MKTHALRLNPGQELRSSIEKLIHGKGIKAGVIVTCVGSLSEVVVRLADKDDNTTFSGPFEIVSLVGTLSPGGVHLHISVSDSKGKTIGGHLRSGNVQTTAEIVIGELEKGVVFSREMDEETGYKELVIKSIS